MSAQSVSFGTHPPHGHPDNTSPSTQMADKPSTASHPPPTKPDPTITGSHSKNKIGDSSNDLVALRTRIKSAIKQYPDWPKKGILFEDIMPIFASPSLHADLISAMERTIKKSFKRIPDVIVALESRGFFFGPSLALRLGCAFVPVRKEGKLPGPVETEAYEKEYGPDYFQIQRGGIQVGQTVLVVDDLIATGGSAAAAGQLVKKVNGELMGYLFLVELEFLKGREKLDKPVHVVLGAQRDEGDTEDLPLGRTHESADEIKSVQDAGGAAAQTRP